MQWLIPIWKQLCDGAKMPIYFPRHPAVYGFRKLAFAEPAGQTEDWVLELADESRLHLWRMPDGRWVMHRDAYDPSRGPLRAVLHVATETKVGKALLAGGAVLGVGALVARGLRA